MIRSFNDMYEVYSLEITAIKLRIQYITQGEFTMYFSIEKKLEKINPK